MPMPYAMYVIMYRCSQQNKTKRKKIVLKKKKRYLVKILIGFQSINRKIEKNYNRC